MITFKEFINEGKFISSLKYNEKVDILKILKTRCSEFLKASKSPIYRGFNGGNTPWFISQPSKHERTSKKDASGNVYTLLIDNLNSWQKFPKRSKSLICTTDQYTAENYGNVYLVIPFDSAKWGVCPEADIWDSFNTLEDVFDTSTLQDFNPRFNDLAISLQQLFPEKLKKFNIKDIRHTTNFKTLLNLLKAMDSCLEELQHDTPKYEKNNPNIIRTYGPVKDWYYNTLNDIYTFVQLRKKHGNIGNILAYALNPDKNGFVLASNKDMNKYVGKYGTDSTDKEVWTDSDCVIIDPDKFTDMFIKPILKKEVEQMVSSNKYEELIEKYKLYDDPADLYQFIRKIVLK